MMDNNFDSDNFERLLREKSDEFRMYPTKRVWHSIYNNIHPSKKWPSIAMCIVLISILLLVGFLNSNNSNQNFAKNTSKFSLATLASTPLNEQKHFFYNSTFVNAKDAFNNAQNAVPAYSIHSINNYFSNLDGSQNEVSQIKDNSIFSRLLAAQNTAINPNGDELSLSDASVYFTKKTFNAKSILALSLGLTDNYAPVAFLTLANKLIQVTQNEPVFNQQKHRTVKNNPSTKLAETAAINTGNEPEITIAEINDERLIIENTPIIIVQNNDEPLTKISIDKYGLKTTVPDITQQNKLASLQKTVLVLSEADKAWVENYAMYNRPAPRLWAGKLGWQFYLTPSVVYRTLKNMVPGSIDINSEVSQHPSIGLEIGAGLIYPIFKGVKIKAGLQLNFTRYNTDAFENSHPVATSITLKQEDQFVQSARATAFSNFGGISAVILHNQTYQISLPIGVDFKIAGNDVLQWNVGATIQPSFVFGGQSYLISSDKRNFIKESALLNKLNVNAGFETFISYKMSGFTLQVGPQFRKQIFTTNNKEYTTQEKLNNYGIKFGITKIIN